MKSKTKMIRMFCLLGCAALAWVSLPGAMPAPQQGPGPGQGPGTGPGPGGPGPSPPPPAQPGVPFAQLPLDLVRRWNNGKSLFLQPANPPQGLGPVFTESACAKCHSSAAVGGAGTRLVTRIGTMTAGVFDPLVAFGGPQIQDHGIGRFNGVTFVGEVVPPQATIVAKRRTIPLFGLGLVDAVPDETFIQLAQEQTVNTPDTAGVVNFVVDPATGDNRVGRFGWKAQEPTLLAFVGDANVNELGVTSPLFPNENCPQGDCGLLAANPAVTHPNETTNEVIDQINDFVTFTAPPPAGQVGPNEEAGGTIFARIGCVNCHIPSLQTGVNTVAALDSVTFAPYSDFLLHDMGPLGDGIVQGQSTPTQMRTAPLWGLRFETTFLHDGRANTPDAAIRAHAGQAAAARMLYVNLNTAERQQVLAFLNSL